MTTPQTSGYLQSSDLSRPRSDAAVPFRDIIPSPSHPRIAGIADHDALSWCESRRQIEAPAWLINRLDKKNLEPYKGFTSDGKVREGLYNYAEDEGAPTEKAMKKVEQLLGVLSEEQQRELHCGEVTDDEFRLWSDPELYVNPGRSPLPYSRQKTKILRQEDSVSTNTPQKSKRPSTIYSKPPSPPKGMPKSLVAASQMTSSVI